MVEKVACKRLLDATSRCEKRPIVLSKTKSLEAHHVVILAFLEHILIRKKSSCRLEADARSHYNDLAAFFAPFRQLVRNILPASSSIGINHLCKQQLILSRVGGALRHGMDRSKVATPAHLEPNASGISR